MNITDQFLKFALLGADWVLILLIILSIASVAVMIERGMFYFKRQLNLDLLSKEVRRALDHDDNKRLEKLFASSEAMPAKVALAGVAARARGVEAVSEAMNSEKSRSRQSHEQNLVLLGTLGNNAPFIGLFGTVLGIIVAFNDLKENPQGGLDVVGGGVSEALVATAVGILVAIPAVVAFNFFNRRVRSATTNTDAIAHVVLERLHGGKESPEPAPEPAPKPKKPEKEAA